VPISTELEERLELWKKRLPNAKNINSSYHGFEFYSYSVMLLGLNYRPEKGLPALDHVSEDNARRAFSSLREKSRRLVTTLPSQVEYLTHVRSQVSSPAARPEPARKRAAMDHHARQPAFAGAM
jgi:tryptophan halogenase